MLGAPIRFAATVVNQLQAEILFGDFIKFFALAAHDYICKICLVTNRISYAFIRPLPPHKSIVYPT